MTKKETLKATETRPTKGLKEQKKQNNESPFEKYVHMSEESSEVSITIADTNSNESQPVTDSSEQLEEELYNQLVTIQQLRCLNSNFKSK